MICPRGSASSHNGAHRCPGSHDASRQEGAFQGSFAIGTTTTEAGCLANTVEAAHRLPMAIENAALQIGLQATQAFAGDQLHADGDEGAGAGFCSGAGLQVRRRSGFHSRACWIIRI